MVIYYTKYHLSRKKIRDKKLGKKIEIHIEGLNTKIDSRIFELLLRQESLFCRRGRGI